MISMKIETNRGCLVVLALGLFLLTLGCSVEAGDSSNGTSDAGSTNDTSSNDACVPVSDDQLCGEKPDRCEEVVLEDNCGDERTVDCNACEDGQCEQGFCVDEACSSHSDCPAAQYCLDGECSEADRVYDTVLIEDRTASEASHRCSDEVDGLPAAGAKIQWVALWEDDSLVSHGSVHDYEQAQASSFGDPTQVIDGTEPMYSGDCPDDDPNLGHNLRDDAIVAIGCHGWLTVRFPRSDGGYFHLSEGYRIEVGEFGPQCNSELQPEDDFYDVSVCQDSIGGPPLGVEDFNVHCDIPLNPSPLTGKNDVPVIY